MKYLVKIDNLKDIELLNDYVDGFIIGNNKVSSMINNSFSLPNIDLGIKKAKELKKEIYILMNKLVFEFEIDNYELMFNYLKDKEMTGIIISDISLISLAQKYNLENKIVYNPTTLITNHIDFNYLKKFNIKGAFISNGLSMNTINEINKQKEINSYYIGFGYINMFYSKRKLISLYYDFKNMEKNKVKTIKKGNYYYIKEETRNEFLHILEDNSGTYIFRANIFNSTKHIEEFINLDYFILDNIFIKTNEMKKFLKELKETKEIKNPNYNYNEGFLFK